MTTSEQNTMEGREGSSETKTEDIERQLKKILDDIEAVSEIVKGIERLRREGRLRQVVATLNALYDNDEKLRAYLLENLHLTFDMLEMSFEELDELRSNAILYYLIRDGKLDEKTQYVIRNIEDPRSNIYTTAVIYTDMDYMWDTFRFDKAYRKSFYLLWARLGYNPAVLEYIIHKHPQLVLNEYSYLLIHGLMYVLPYYRIHRILMSSRDESGRTHFFNVRVFPSARPFAKPVDDLYELLSIPDVNGQTALHVRTDLITDLLIDTYKGEHRDRLMKLITIEDKNGKTALDVTDEKRGLSWLQDQLKNNRYIPYNKPIVLIAYTTKNRPGAEDEARSIHDAFEEKISQEYFGFPLYNVKVVEDPWKEDLINLIEQLANGKDDCGRPPSALIVVLMSHGSVGTIDDSKGEPISLTAIEAAMCEKNKMSDNPKILITQSCQSRDSKSQRLNQDPSSSTSDTGPPVLKNIPYVCTINRNFCAYMSSVRGQTSDRGVFINKFAVQIKNCKENETIDSLFKKVCQEMKSEGKPQIPIHAGNTLSIEFCPANHHPVLTSNDPDENFEFEYFTFPCFGHNCMTPSHLQQKVNICRSNLGSPRVKFV